MDKEAIKKELLEESNNILAKYDEMECVDTISVMNMAAKTVFLGSLRIYKEEVVSSIKKDIKKQFAHIGDITVRDEKVVPCCAPKYIHVSFNVSVTN